MKNFLNSISKGLFPTIIAFSALSVSASAAFYSVSGLSKLFAGASFEVIIMASSLEIAKLVIASLLYQYWNTLNKLLKIYLTSAAAILVLITSMGIYGFLSAAYQETYSQLSVVENQKSFIQQKVNFYQKDVTRYDEELERISSNISTLSNAKSTSIQVRDTTSSTGFRNTISTTELRLSQNRISAEEENRKDVQSKREVAADSLQKFQLQVLELENNTEVAGELGPLKYLSGLTGAPMDKIINWLLLVIIFVFDPLAISLVVAANMAFDKTFPKTKKDEDWIELYPDPNDLPDLEEEGDENHALDIVLNNVVEDIEVREPEVVKTQEKFLDQLDIIDSKYVNNEVIEQQQEKIKNLESELELANEEINELDRAAIKIVDSLKHLDDYLKHHGKAYSPLVTNWNEIKLGFAEEDDYIEQRKLRSKPIGKLDPYLDKNIDPDYPKNKESDDIITY
jgi:small-conductance mechanosensitive channel